ncbi:MAG: TonB C-terminal domain-containing protein, partial [Bdellovibrionales bacterium]|nr:TonB C-terminal domain-containing protein [Bdellovibrionales bacterium]
ELVQIQEKKNGKPILQPDVPPEMLDPQSKKTTDFLSARTQRVLKETVARQTGLTQNRIGGVPGKTLPLVDMIQKGSRPKTTDQKLLASEHSDIQFREQRDEGKQNDLAFRKGKNMMNLGQGVSTLNERLPGIDAAAITALNTDTYLFYSFYNRMVTQVRYHWERNVVSATEVAMAARKYLPEKEEWVTVAEITLDKDGNYEKTAILRSSGFDLLDKAVGAAYKAGSPIRNPPREMLGSDDKILITMSFSIAWKPMYLSKKPGREMPGTGL